MATTTVTTRFSNINNNHHRMPLDMAVTDDNTHRTSPTKKTKLVLKVSEMGEEKRAYTQRQK
jgi:hypothetical protein